MVKRVKDMVEKVGVEATKSVLDTKRVLSDVAQIDTLVAIDRESDNRGARGKGKKGKYGSRDDHSHDIVVPEHCPICEMGLTKMDIKYYDVALLKKFMSVRAKIIPKSKSGVCAMHQRALAHAVQRARYLAMLPFVDMGL